MAAAMAAAAALGFFGASQASTSFVVSSGAPAQLSAASISNVGAAAQSRSGPAPSSALFAMGSEGAALFAGAMLGMGGAFASMKDEPNVQVKEAKPVFDPTKAIGVLEPTGFWDPCGLMRVRVGKDGWEWKDEATFNKYRTAELKHGRLCMLAAGGMIANTFWKFPGFEGVPDGVKALSDVQGGSGFGIIFIMAAYVELIYPDGKFSDPLKLGAYNNWGYSEEMQNKELANGRVAMAAILTLFITEYGTQMTPSQQWAETHLLNFAGPLLLLGFALGNPEGWKKGEYSPSLLATGGTLSTVEGEIKQVTLSASLPESVESVKASEKVEEMAVA